MRLPGLETFVNKNIYIFNHYTACRFGVCPFISSEQLVYWLAQRQSLKAIITCGMLLISELEYFVGSNSQLRTLSRVGLLTMTNVGSIDIGQPTIRESLSYKFGHRIAV